MKEQKHERYVSLLSSRHHIFTALYTIILLEKSVSQLWLSGKRARGSDPCLCSFVVCECPTGSGYDHDIGTSLVPISWSTPSLVAGCGIGVNPIPSHWMRQDIGTRLVPISWLSTLSLVVVVINPPQPDVSPSRLHAVAQ